MSRNEEERIQELEKAVNKSHVEGYFGDLNDINTTGVVYAGATATNKPGSGANGVNNGYCITLFFIEGYKKQIYYLQNNTNYCYERTCNKGVWTEWIGGIEELNVASLLQNGWAIHTNSECFIIKNKNMVHIQLCITAGTNTLILRLPTKYRPTKTIYAPCSSTNVANTNYCFVSDIGELKVDGALTGKMLFINFSYRI